MTEQELEMDLMVARLKGNDYLATNMPGVWKMIHKENYTTSRTERVKAMQDELKRKMRML